MPWRSSVIAASDPTLTFVCPEGPGAFWYVLLVIAYHYFYGTARIQDDSSTILVTTSMYYYCGYVGVWLVAVHGD